MKPSSDSPPPAVITWYVYSADRHLVATYPSQAAAAAHVASWPASFYQNVPLSGAPTQPGLGSPLDKSTGMKSDG